MTKLRLLLTKQTKTEIKTNLANYVAFNVFFQRTQCVFVRLPSVTAGTELQHDDGYRDGKVEYFFIPF